MYVQSFTVLYPLNSLNMFSLQHVFYRQNAQLWEGGEERASSLWSADTSVLVYSSKSEPCSSGSCISWASFADMVQTRRRRRGRESKPGSVSSLLERSANGSPVHEGDVLLSSLTFLARLLSFFPAIFAYFYFRTPPSACSIREYVFNSIRWCRA